MYIYIYIYIYIHRANDTINTTHHNDKTTNSTLSGFRPVTPTLKGNYH